MNPRQRLFAIAMHHIEAALNPIESLVGCLEASVHFSPHFPQERQDEVFRLSHPGYITAAVGIFQTCAFAAIASGRRRRVGGPLLDRQMHDPREDAEGYAEPPDHVVGARLVVEPSAKPYAQERPDLM